MNFENLGSVQGSKQWEKKPESKRDAYERVTAMALDIIKEERGLKYGAKAENLIADSEFRELVKRGWREQYSKRISPEEAEDSLEGETQEKKWAEGLAMRIKDKLDS